MKVLIADHHPLYREAAALQLRRLHPDARVTEVATLAELRQAAKISEHFDLILIGGAMPGMSQLALEKFARNHPGVPLAVIYDRATLIEMRAAIRAGVRGYISKTASARYFRHALQLLLAGGISIPAEVLLTEARASGWQGTISKREADVLKHIVHGLPNKEIARRLGMAEVTVKLHLRSVYRKMNVRNRVEAAIKAAQFDVT